jgi:hypothetical protein
MKKYKKAVAVAAFAITSGSAAPLSTTSADEGELGHEVLNRISINGLIEVEAANTDAPDADVNDITLSTLEVGVDAQVNPWVNAYVLILFEEDETDPPEIDEGIIILENSDLSDFYIAAGRMYIPFGNFTTNGISDPLTLEIGETRETALQAGYFSNGFYGSLFLFNGDTREDEREAIDQFGLNMGFINENEATGLGYDIGFSWVNSLADSDSLQEAISDPENLTDKVSGFGIHGIIHSGPFSLIGEYLTASDTFDAADLSYNNAGAKPAAFNLEVGYSTQLAGIDATLAIAWQETHEALMLELPKKRYLAALSMDILEQTTLSLEYLKDDDYDIDEGGSGDNFDTFTVQLAVEF